MLKFVELNSKEGEQFLKKSLYESYCLNSLNKTIKRQLTEYTCGISSLSAISNAWYLENNAEKCPLGRKLPYDEEVFTPKFYELKPLLHEGININELSRLINNTFGNAIRVDKKLCTEEMTIDLFKSDIIKSVKSSCQTIVILNYLLNSICDEWLPFGHFSPISAYEEISEIILIADTYMPSYWVSVNDMFKAIDTVDPDSNHKRGYLLLTWQIALK